MENQPDATPLQPSGARCAQHVESPAAIICSRCGSYACSSCRQWGPHGEDFCASCAPFQPELAERGSRLLASMVDQFLFLGPWFMVGVVSSIATGSASGSDGKGALIGAGLLLLTLGLMGVQLFLVARNGQSIGKRMLGIKVIRTDGSPVSLGRILFLRNLIPGAIGSLCGLFGLVDALFIFKEDRCCLHDKMADTLVVKVDGTGGNG
ncbi:RDD family protein [Archangium sp.]|uniref:RDD family protein n=1 Tax=Archangium sp. TaxID=1872627 RepID=UPI002D698310|nr:RDD family protein [Archangium sp.]HYO52053.1 RDD family protein [Archangium sp.]